jgi:uncharacterized repeat protein (TIGR02543 family)
MNAYQLCSNITAALKASSTLVSALTTLLGKSPSWFVGFDSRNPAAADKVPFIVFSPGDDNIIDNTSRRHDIVLGCACNDETVTTVAGITTFSGLGKAAQFAELVDAAVKAYLDEESQRLSLLEWSPTSYENYHPDYHATKQYTVISVYVQHIVTFNSNGGSTVAAQTVDDATVAVTPTPPTKTGNTFAGWYSDSGLTQAYAFTTLVTSSFTLYAKWT